MLDWLSFVQFLTLLQSQYFFFEKYIAKKYKRQDSVEGIDCNTDINPNGLAQLYLPLFFTADWLAREEDQTNEILHFCSFYLQNRL